MSKLKLATVWLDGCSGCHMSFLDMDERLLAIAELVDVPEAFVVALNTRASALAALGRRDEAELIFDGASRFALERRLTLSDAQLTLARIGGAPRARRSGEHRGAR